MQSNIQTAIRLIFPPRCVNCGDLVESDFGLCGPCWRDMSFIGGTVCGKCGCPIQSLSDDDSALCDDCMQYERPWSKGRSALLYKENARRLVLALKHGDRHDIVYPAARWMALAAKPLRTKNMIIVPVPLHRMRLFQRRFNQAALLARALSQEMGNPCCLDLLERRKGGGTTRGLGYEQRFEKLNGAITVNPKRVSQIEGKTVLVVDDVMTSGATLTAATEACFSAGAEDVRILALARAAKEA